MKKWNGPTISFIPRRAPPVPWPPRPVHTTKELPLPDVQSDWSDYYRNIVEVLEGRAKATVQLPQVLRVMKVIDTVFASAEAGHGLSCYI